ncbi:hypothetical protein Tco_0806676 [Tanacetum coccineum]
MHSFNSFCEVAHSSMRILSRVKFSSHDLIIHHSGHDVQRELRSMQAFSTCTCPMLHGIFRFDRLPPTMIGFLKNKDEIGPFIRYGLSIKGIPLGIVVEGAVQDRTVGLKTIRCHQGSQNMAFVSTPGSKNEDIAYVQVSTASTPVNAVSTNDNAASLSDAIVYSFLANQPCGSQLVHKDLEQIHDDDLEKIDLKWQLALLAINGAGFDWSYMAE